MAVEQVYVFDIDSEKIKAAVATDGTTVQYLGASVPRDSDANERMSASYAEKLTDEAVAEYDIPPMEAVMRNVYAMVTDEVEFPDFDAAAEAAQELFDRDAVADEFAI